ncbi:putative EH-domain protein [Gregarina niphandrodes]|uniref:EH-domain protein n=1 Tax=Gregarina niphandrodes TaxID=110365 RepID=A0A023B3X3_GRENI|nr:putative EH-domain protein [Gregarina niphandrodes]EZG56067.1 putative EH-domain protein [Gregarina niphandrodes]|eukprot:XP_011131356.1 putative EH-domain protein [Gregarina niphandrodes]
MWKGWMSSRSLEAVSPGSVACRADTMESFQSITCGLAEIYKKHVLPVERDFRYDQFYSPALTDGDFKAKPMVLLLGQYSTGKTTFIRHLLEKDYPGLRIGPEPTTDKFVAVCHSDDCTDSGNAPAQVLPGHAAVVDRNLPWSQLESFGPGFLSRFEVVHVKSHVFKGVTLIDTPGVLAGNKQWERGYDFEGVIKWFAERVDLVLLFFDAHKLDISDEFRRCILALKGFESKVCILLNKADSVNAHHLMRVYGALMWSLGKVMAAPEVPRIYIGSFWDQPLTNNEVYKLFEQETDDLFKLIYSLPARSAARKIDDFLKRVRRCYTHCILIDHMRRQIPILGKSAKQKEMLDHLEEICQHLATRYQIPASDFPSPQFLRSKLNDSHSLNRFPKMDHKKLGEITDIVKKRVASLTKLIPHEEANSVEMSSPLIIAENERTLSPTIWFKARSKVITSRRLSNEDSNQSPSQSMWNISVARTSTEDVVQFPELGVGFSRGPEEVHGRGEHSPSPGGSGAGTSGGGGFGAGGFEVPVVGPVLVDGSSRYQAPGGGPGKGVALPGPSGLGPNGLGPNGLGPNGRPGTGAVGGPVMGFGEAAMRPPAARESPGGDDPALEPPESDGPEPLSCSNMSSVDEAQAMDGLMSMRPPPSSRPFVEADEWVSRHVDANDYMVTLSTRDDTSHNL